MSKKQAEEKPQLKSVEEIKNYDFQSKEFKLKAEEIDRKSIEIIDSAKSHSTESLRRRFEI